MAKKAQKAQTAPATETTLDNATLTTLATLKDEIESLEGDFEYKEEQLSKVKKLETELKDIGDSLTAKRTEWDKAISTLPDNVRELLSKETSSISRVRKQVSSKTPTTSKGKDDIIQWLKDHLADGAKYPSGKPHSPATDKDLRSDFELKFGQGKRLRMDTYINNGTIKKTKDGLIVLV